MIPDPYVLMILPLDDLTPCCYSLDLGRHSWQVWSFRRECSVHFISTQQPSPDSVFGTTLKATLEKQHETRTVGHGGPSPLLYRPAGCPHRPHALLPGAVLRAPNSLLAGLQLDCLAKPGGHCHPNASRGPA